MVEDSEQVSDFGTKSSSGFLTEPDDFSKKFRRLCQRWDDRLTLKTLAFSKDYRNGRLKILFEMNLSASHDHDWDKCVLCFQAANGTTIGERNVFGDQACRSNGKSKPSVLINVVELIDGADKVIPSVGTINFIKDRFRNARIEGLYLSRNGSFKSYSGVGDREVPARVVAASVALNFTGNVVECGSQIVGGVTDHEGNHGGSGKGVELDILHGAIRVELTDYSCSVVLDKPFQQKAKLVDMLIGPFNL